MKITIAGTTALEDNSTHTNRFEIYSETSNRVYVVAQSKSTGEWGCSCPGWCIKRQGKERDCKHLKALLPILLAAENTEVKKISSSSKPTKKRKIQI
jgi:hypothetical protein